MKFPINGYSMVDMEISEALRDAIEARMDELELSPTDLEDRTGVSGTGLLNLRRGEVRKYQMRLTSPVCRVLGWRSDGIARLLRGEQPLLVDQEADVTQSDGPSLEDRRQARGAVRLTVEKMDERLRALEVELIEVRGRLDAIDGRLQTAGA